MVMQLVNKFGTYNYVNREAAIQQLGEERAKDLLKQNVIAIGKPAIPAEHTLEVSEDGRYVIVTEDLSYSPAYRDVTMLSELIRKLQALLNACGDRKVVLVTDKGVDEHIKVRRSEEYLRKGERILGGSEAVGSIVIDAAFKPTKQKWRPYDE